MFTQIIILLNITHAEGIFLAFDSFFSIDVGDVKRLITNPNATN